MSRPYYSQCAQDKIADAYFGGKTDGVFLEIGANDGLGFSNSKFFEDGGWTGMCIEANPSEYAKLCQNRPNAINVFGAAYNRSGEISFRVNEGYTNMLSGIEEAYHPAHVNRIARELQQMGGSSRLVTVPAFTLTDKLAEHGLCHVDYLSLDVEGAELQVLEGIDFSKITFNFMSIEDNYKQEAEFDAVLLKHGYKKYGPFPGHDLFYCRP